MPVLQLRLIYVLQDVSASYLDYDFITEAPSPAKVIIFVNGIFVLANNLTISQTIVSVFPFGTLTQSMK